MAAPSHSQAHPSRNFCHWDLGALLLPSITIVTAESTCSPSGPDLLLSTQAPHQKDVHRGEPGDPTGHLLLSSLGEGRGGNRRGETALCPRGQQPVLSSSGVRSRAQSSQLCKSYKGGPTAGLRIESGHGGPWDFSIKVGDLSPGYPLPHPNLPQFPLLSAHQHRARQSLTPSPNALHSGMPKLGGQGAFGPTRGPWPSLWA